MNPRPLQMLRRRGAVLAAFLGTAPATPGQEGLRPIRGPIVPGFWAEHAAWAIPAIALGAIVLLLLARWIRQRSQRERILYPRERYNREIHAMRELLTAGQAEEIPPRLSRVLREYIEGSTGIRAPEQTTEEFLARAGEATGQPIPAAALGGLSDFLALLDQAKYARRQLDTDELHSLLESADRFVAANEEGNPEP